MDILAVVAEEKIRFTRLMYRSNTSWKSLIRHIAILIKTGAIKEHLSYTKMMHKERRSYTITQKGISMLKYWNEINGRVKE